MKVLLLMCTMCALTSSSSRFSEVTFSFHSWGNGGIKRLLEREERERKRRGKEEEEGRRGEKEGRGGWKDRRGTGLFLTF